MMIFKPVLGDQKKRPLLIAGPCSAETEDQVLETARALAACGKTDFFRAGIWKPRTRPGEFEGVGSVGLPWMRRAKEETGLKMTTEVGTHYHVFEALKYGMDALWIGARTTANPFSVQEIADALKGTDIPVFIKNPVNADLKLWIGAIERVYKAGISRIAAIHRGFTYHGQTPFRNMPHWQIPIDLKRAFPDLPILCDNSHICGRRDILFDVAQKAFDLNFDGLMTETHPNPDKAWSDAAQQITPQQYDEMIARLVIRPTESDDREYIEHLVHLRNEIDDMDEELINLLGRRMKVADKIGEYKKHNNIAIYQNARWNEILEKAIDNGRRRGLSEEFVSIILKAIHDESINHQEEVLKK